MRTLPVKLILAIVTITMDSDMTVASKSTTSSIRNQTLEAMQAPHAIEEPYVPGVAFSRILQIWLENTNFEVRASSTLLEY